MSTNGHLKFQGTNRATFVGETSNIMFDTTTTSLGIGVTGTDHPSSNLYITGNAYVTSDIGVGGVLTMGTVNVVARHDLEAVTATGNTTPLTVEFSNATTGIVTTGNVEVGGELTVSGNATVSSNLIVSGNVEVGTANLFVDTMNSRVGIGTTSPQNMLHVYKANNDETSGILIEKAHGGLGTAASLFFGVASTTETNNRGIPKAAIFYERNLVNGRGDIKFCNDAIDDTNPVSTAASDTRMIIKNNGNVGVGTVSPDEKLHVNGNIRLGGPQGTDENASYYIKSAGQIHINSAADGTADDSYICLDLRAGQTGSNRSGIGICGAATSTAYQHIVFETTDAERMRINYDGKVGIGTTAPGSTLDVHGTDTSPIKKTAPSAATNSYNFVLNGPRPGTTTHGATHFINGSTRNDDGGASTYTIRNDSGQLRLGNSSYTTIFGGNHLRMAEGDNSYFHFGPNGAWSGELYVGATSDRTSSSYTTKAQVIATDGNLHLDSGNARDIYMNYYRGNYIRHHGLGVYSDDRLKSEEELLTNATDTLLKLSPQKYLKRHTLREDEDRDPLVETGLIAQDIWYDAPELRHLVQLGDGANPTDIKPEAPVVGDIQQDPDYSSWGPKEASVNYNGLIAYLIKSNQELHNRIQALENAS